MDLKTLKTFQTIAACGSFHRAAERLNYAQSTVTMQIQRLEAELGAALIERGKKIRLTEAGRLLHEQSVSLVRNLEQLHGRIADLQDGGAGHIRLGVTEPSASARMPQLLARFLGEYPKIRVTIDIGSTAVLSGKLLNGELDLALCSAPEIGTELYFEPLFTERFVLLVPADHPLAERASVDTESIREYRLLITAADCPYRRKLELALQESGRTPFDTMEIGSMSALPHYVQCGFGIALVPESSLTISVPAGTVARRLAGRPVDMLGGLLVRTSETALAPACTKLYRFLEQELRETD